MALLLPLAFAFLVLAPAPVAAADEPGGLPDLGDIPPPERPAWEKKRSGVALDLDASTALPRATPDTSSAGFGFDARPGYRFAVGPIFLVPQADIGTVTFPKFDSAVRFGAGGRVGVDAGRIEPSVYAFGGGFWNVWKTGWGVRTGASLDVRLGKRFSPGVHVDYNMAGWDTSSVSYVGIGAHLGLVL
jgi:hypothetical protein